MTNECYYSASSSRVYCVYNLGDFYDVIDHIGKLAKNKTNISNYPIPNSPGISTLWFRGHEFNHYKLMPSLIRDDCSIQNRQNHTMNYSSLRLKEDYYYQSFRAKTGHRMNCAMDSQFDYEEVMQHHIVKTRLMDWTESASVALLFSLESIINPKDDENCKSRRQNITPTIWVQIPQEINQYVYRKITAPKELIDNGRSTITYPLIERALTDLYSDVKKRKRLATELGNELTKGHLDYFSLRNNFPEPPEEIIDGMLSLSVINSSRVSCQSRLPQMIESMEYNPFHYLIARYYIDGLPISPDELPPISVVHPYHSERIEAQKGAFSVFPNYCLNNECQRLHAIGLDLRAMENQSDICNYLFEIRICNPYKVARELLVSGERYSRLYPEIEKYSYELCNPIYHI